MNNQTSDIIIGEQTNWGEPQPFGVAAVDERQHLYIIGKTGTGKTTLLRNLILQHIALGHGVGVIDPHGDLAEELLNHISTKRADHLVYFNPGDVEFPVGLNVIGSVAPDDRHLVASGVVAAFKGIWRDSWGPRLEYILYNAVSALLECRNQTLQAIHAEQGLIPAFQQRRDGVVENIFKTWPPGIAPDALKRRHNARSDQMPVIG